MQFFRQETYYTCGCACFRMALSHFKLNVPRESNLAKQMHTTPENTGTSYEDMIRIGMEYGLEIQSGQDGDLKQLDNLIKDGWVVVLGISLSVPHFVVYLENNGNHIFLNDPFRGERSNFELKKFLKNHWWVDHKKYGFITLEYPEIEFHPSIDSYRWWIAYKPKE